MLFSWCRIEIDKSTVKGDATIQNKAERARTDWTRMVLKDHEAHKRRLGSCLHVPVHLRTLVEFWEHSEDVSLQTLNADRLHEAVEDNANEEFPTERVTMVA